MSLKDKIFNWLKKQPMIWVSGVSIEKIVMQKTNHGGAAASRICRQLAQDGQIEREERPWNGKKLAYYRYNPSTNIDDALKQDLEWYNKK